MDLITPARATQNLALASLSSTNPGYLASLIAAASDAIRRTCGRDFTLGSYVEYHNESGAPGSALRLRQFPVVEVTRVTIDPRAALRVCNLDGTVNQRATVETTGVGLRLVRIASAVPTNVELTFAAYPTIALLAAAVSALGNGWTAEELGPFGPWPAADLRPLQGAATALVGDGGGAGCDLELYAETLAPLAFDGCDDPRGGAGWRLDADTGELFARVPRGVNVRIDYRAGFATVPPPVQEACVQLVQDLYQATLANHSFKRTTLGPSTVELNTAAGSAMSPKVRLLLAPFMDYSKVIFR